jgi:hypothetical protein
VRVFKGRKERRKAGEERGGFNRRCFEVISTSLIGSRWQCFVLPEFEVKFETRNGTIFMFKADKVLHCTMKNQGGNQYGMAFFQKNSVLNHLKSLKG